MSTSRGLIPDVNSTTLEAYSKHIFYNESIFTPWSSGYASRPLYMKLVEQSKQSTIIQLVLVAVTMAVSFTGNTLTLLSVYKCVYLRSVSSYLVANLAIIDLGLSFLILPTVAATVANQHWMLNRALCISAGFIDTLLTNAQVMALLAIGINRYMAMLHPNWYSSNKSKRLFIKSLVLGWIYSIFWSIPPFLGWGRYAYTKGTLFCAVSWNETPYFAISHLVLSYVIPSLVGLYFYIGVVRAVSRYFQQIGAHISDTDILENGVYHGTLEYRDEIVLREHQLPRSRPFSTFFSSKLKKPEIIQVQNVNAPVPQPRHSKQLWQVTKAFLVIVLTFLVCWIPRGIANIWAVIEGRSSVPLKLEIYSTLLIFATSAFNPLVYGLCRADFRKAFKTVLLFWVHFEDR